MFAPFSYFFKGNIQYFKLFLNYTLKNLINFKILKQFLNFFFHNFFGIQ